MTVGIVSSTTMAKFHRMDPEFLILAQKHEVLCDEIVAKLTKEEICDLAKKLPYDGKAGRIVCPRRGLRRELSEADFMSWVTAVDTGTVANQSSFLSLAVYCCEAAQHTVSKFLTEMLRLAEQKNALLLHVLDLLKTTNDKGCKKLHVAMTQGDVLKRVLEMKPCEPAGTSTEMPMTMQWQMPPHWIPNPKYQSSEVGTWSYPWPSLFLGYLAQFDKIMLLGEDRTPGLAWGNTAPKFQAIDGDDICRADQITMLCPISNPRDTVGAAAASESPVEGDVGLG